MHLTRHDLFERELQSTSHGHAFLRRSPHNAEKFDRKGEKSVVQILDFKEALWLQLT